MYRSATNHTTPKNDYNSAFAGMRCK